MTVLKGFIRNLLIFAGLFIVVLIALYFLLLGNLFLGEKKVGYSEDIHGCMDTTGLRSVYIQVSDGFERIDKFDANGCFVFRAIYFGVGESDVPKQPKLIGRDVLFRIETYGGSSKNYLCRMNRFVKSDESTIVFEVPKFSEMKMLP